MTMFQRLATAVTAVIFLLLVYPVCAGEPFPADRHMAYGADCVSCHASATPEAGADVESARCLACHGDRKSLAAKFTAMGGRNPHDNHQGELDCVLCHTGHKQPVAYCANCHRDFELKMR